MSLLFSAPTLARYRACRFSVIALVAILLHALALSPHADAVEAPLTLAQAQHLALERSRQLAGQDHAVAAARELAVAAGQLPDPVLKLGIDNLPVSGSGRFSLGNDFMTMRRAGVMQEITRADKRHLRAEKFEHMAQKTLAEKAVAQAAIARDTALAWLDRYYAEARAGVIAEQEVQAKLEIQAAEGAYRGARGNLAELFAARSVLATLGDQASESERRIRTATLMLSRWIGPAAELPLAAAPATDTIDPDRAKIADQLTHHPELAVLAKQENIAELDVQLAQADQRSDWTVEVALQQRGPAYSNMISLGVSIPLQWDQKNRQDRELSSRLALLEQAKAEREEMLRAHLAEVQALLLEWDSNRERSTRYRHQLMPLAQQRMAATITSYQGGKASLADVLSARRNEIDVRLRSLELEADTARLWAQLNFLSPGEGAPAHSALTINKAANE